MLARADVAGVGTSIPHRSAGLGQRSDGQDFVGTQGFDIFHADGRHADRFAQRVEDFQNRALRLARRAEDDVVQGGQACQSVR